MNEVVVLIPGYSDWVNPGQQRASGTVTLIKGEVNVIVDTGVPIQRDEIKRRLKENGLRPENIKFVVLTHGQSDHVGNNSLFPNATFLLDTDVCQRDAYAVHDFHLDAFHIAPGIEVIQTPGHTDHDLSVVVESKLGTVVIAGDIFERDGDWIDKSWEAWSKNRKKQQKSRDKILRIADYIVPGHGNMFAVPHEEALKPVLSRGKDSGQDHFLHQHAREIADLAQRFGSYWSHVTAEKIGAWLRQFGGYPEMGAILPLLKHIRYIDDATTGDVFAEFYRALVARMPSKQVCCTRLGQEKDSSSRVSYDCAKGLTDQERRGIRFGTIESLAASVPADRAIVVFVDDVISSGDQPIRIFGEWLGMAEGPSEYVEPLPHGAAAWLRGVELVYFGIVGIPSGVDRVEQEFTRLGLNGSVHKGVAAGAGCFTASDLIYQDPQVRLSAKKLVAEIGMPLFSGEQGWSDDKKRQWALGKGGRQQLLVFQHNTPTCTLPVLWRSGMVGGKPWVPLFPRRE